MCGEQTIDTLLSCVLKGLMMSVQLSLSGDVMRLMGVIASLWNESGSALLGWQSYI